MKYALTSSPDKFPHLFHSQYTPQSFIAPQIRTPSNLHRTKSLSPHEGRSSLKESRKRRYTELSEIKDTYFYSISKPSQEEFLKLTISR